MTVTFAARLQSLVPPVYLRKLDKRSHWGHATDDLKARAEHAALEAFEGATNPFSLFLVENEDHLRLILVGLNSMRASPNQQIDFVVFTKPELIQARIDVQKVAGNTNCHFANRLHVDALPQSSNSILSLCEAAMQSGREAFRIPRPEVILIHDWALTVGCEALTSEAKCPCSSWLVTSMVELIQ